MSSQLDYAERPFDIEPINPVIDFLFRSVLALVAIGIIGGAVYLMLKMSEAMQEQGGRYLVAVGAFVLLIGVETQFTRLAWRRLSARPDATWRLSALHRSRHADPGFRCRLPLHAGVLHAVMGMPFLGSFPH